jgi:hypothetical protein
VHAGQAASSRSPTVRTGRCGEALGLKIQSAISRAPPKASLDYSIVRAREAPSTKPRRALLKIQSAISRASEILLTGVSSHPDT